MAKKIPSHNFTKRLTDSLGFSISKLEKSYGGYNSSNPHRHNYYELISFQQTGGEHEIDFKSYKIKAESIHFISPNQVHLLRRTEKVTGFVISFTDDFLLEKKTELGFLDSMRFLNKPSSSPILQLNKSLDVKTCKNYIAKILEEYESKNVDKQIALSSWLKLFLVFCNRLHSKINTKSKNFYHYSDITTKFKRLLENHFKEIKSVKEYASLLSISPGHLSDTIQKDISKSASELIHDRLILEAKRLLYHSQFSIKEIANELNYEDPSYFSKFFKSHSGTSPEQFRISIREKHL